MRAVMHTARAGSDSVTENPELIVADPSPFHRVISIEEDHLQHLLDGEPYPLFHQLNEEEDGAQIDLQMSPMCPSNMSLASVFRRQPVGKKTFKKVKGGS